MAKRVSIIVPCKNEEAYIERCISSILKNNYPSELMTIFVCDGNSTDKTTEIVSKFTQIHPNIHLLNNPQETTPFGLNLGLKKAETDIKIILGAHAEVDENFIAENVAALERDASIGCAGGYIENVYESEHAKIIGMAMSSPFGVGNAHFRTQEKSGYVDTVAFGAYKKEVFEKIGYFDEDLTRNQDDEFNYRLIKNGFKIYLSDRIKSLYYVRSSYKNLAKQYYQYGYWKVFVNKKHGTITSYRQLAPLMLVLFLLLGGIGSFLHPWAFYLYLLGGSFYLFFALYSALRKTKRLEYVIKLCYTFITLHLSYGLGYLVGIIDFTLLNKQPRKRTKELSR